MKTIFLKQRISYIAITLLAVNPKLETMTGFAWWKTLLVQSIGHIFLFIIMIEFKDSFKDTKLTYLIPDFQNPSATTYSDEKRIEIAKIVEQENGLLIEDSPYSELFFDKKNISISSKKYYSGHNSHLITWV